MDRVYDDIVIGAGHNGLTCAAYLARAGRRVLVVERREVVGGACVTDELVEGFRFSTASLVTSLFQQSIIDELRLRDHGFSTVPRDPSVVALFPDGRHLMLGSDPARCVEQVAQFSTRDAEAYPRYGATMRRLFQATEWLLAGEGRRPLADDPAALRSLLRQVDGLPDDDLCHLVSVLFDSARNFLDRWFETDHIKAPLAIDGITGVAAGPSAPGTAYLMLYHMAGSTETGRPAWGHVRGGMGGLTRALAAAAESWGVEIVTGCAVREIRVDDGHATGVHLADGRVARAGTVISAADPAVTVGLVDPDALPSGYRHAVRQLRFDGIAAKIHLALDRLPAVRGFPDTGQPGPQHRGTLLIAPTLDYLDEAYEDARRGIPSRHPHIECTIPTVLDPDLAPPGKHVLSMYVQYAPYALGEGKWEETKDRFADRVMACAEEHLPGLTAATLDRVVLSPVDLEQELGLTGGNLYHGAMSPRDLVLSRPVAGYPDYTTPLGNLFLCGSATRPGGGVFGVPGRNAARTVLATTAGGGAPGGP